ncbi:acid-shock protein [Nitrospirillum iridis]|uniref:Putative membrane protein YqiK n=1 Tax=Nitrospirillum iridis TaxID=765888 RepID=A0A7X0EEX8_9PROT|nr:acid-shock protein [Nitrospirillum iridis]MBB6252496.1 putative membrane protein YqiK [Nitrospirillum iridis]
MSMFAHRRPLLALAAATAMMVSYGAFAADTPAAPATTTPATAQKAPEAAPAAKPAVEAKATEVKTDAKAGVEAKATEAKADAKAPEAKGEAKGEAKTTTHHHAKKAKAHVGAETTAPKK